MSTVAVVQCIGGPQDGVLIGAPSGARFTDGCLINVGPECDPPMCYMVNAAAGTAVWTPRPIPQEEP